MRPIVLPPASETSVSHDQFDRCWPWLAKAVGAFGHTHGKDDVWREIEARSAQFWPLQNSAIVTNVYLHPTGLREFRPWLAGGELAELQAFGPTLKAVARSAGCNVMTICGRLGWMRSLPGYREAAILMSREL